MAENAKGLGAIIDRKYPGMEYALTARLTREALLASWAVRVKYAERVKNYKKMGCVRKWIL